MGRILDSNLKLHKAIWIYHNGDSEGFDIDHINGNTLDNRIENLRMVTHQKNTQNATLRKDSKTGHTGVTLDKISGKWHARIKVNYESIHLGRYENIEDAIEARRLANIKYKFHKNHGKSGPLSSE